MKAKCKARVGAAIGRSPTEGEASQIDRQIKRSMRALSKSDPDWQSLSAEQRLERAGEHAAQRQEAQVEDGETLFQSNNGGDGAQSQRLLGNQGRSTNLTPETSNEETPQHVRQHSFSSQEAEQSVIGAANEALAEAADADVSGYGLGKVVSEEDLLNDAGIQHDDGFLEEPSIAITPEIAQRLQDLETVQGDYQITGDKLAEILGPDIGALLDGFYLNGDGLQKKDILIEFQGSDIDEVLSDPDHESYSSAYVATDALNRISAERVNSGKVETVEDALGHEIHAVRAAAFRAAVNAYGLDHSLNGTSGLSSEYIFINPINEESGADVIKIRFADHTNQSRLHQHADYNFADGQYSGKEILEVLREIGTNPDYSEQATTLFQSKSDSVSEAQAEGYEGENNGEAKEWLEAVAKGLDMSLDARMERARAMGFDTETQYYHGTDADISEFDAVHSNRLGTDGVFLSTNSEISESYARSKANASGKSEIIYPVFVRGDIADKKTDLSINERHSDHLLPGVMRRLKSQGKTAYRHALGEDYFVFDPSNIRSIHAAFDPDKSDSANLLAQPDGAGPKPEARASVSIPGGFGVGKILEDGNVIVRLTEAVNETSFLHETAHIFLEIYGALEGTGSTEVDAQMQAIRDWLGIKDGEAITRDQHEKFADSFELYLKRGIAPSPELRSAFVQFRQWFVNAYRNIKHRLTKLDPEAIEIFDAMLATDEEVGLAIEDYGRTLSGYMSKTMSEEQLAKYRKYADQARVTAEDKLFRKHLAQIEKRNRAEYRRAKKAAKERIQAELDAEPVYRARKAIADQKLDRELVRELRSEGFERETTETGGAHPEIVAAEAGFASADGMLTALETAPALAAEVDRRVQAELDAEYGNLLTDGSAEQEAVQAVFNENSIRMMEAERDALAHKAGRDPIPLAAIRAKADKDINELPIREAIKPGRYAIKARDLHKRSIRAAAQGKWDLALRYTHQAMLQHEKARRAYKARDEIARGERALAKFRRHRKLDPKKIDPEYISAIRILADLPGSPDQELARQQLEAFALKQELGTEEGGGGIHVLLPTAVVLGEDLKDKRDMSMDEWRDYKASIQSLNKMGRDLSAEAKAAQKAEALDIADTIREGWEGRTPKDKRRDKNLKGKIGQMLRQGDAMILRFPFLIEALQGGGTDGKLVRDLELKIRQGLTDRNDRRVELGRELAAIFEKHEITQKELRKLVEVPELDGAPISFERVLVAAMNMGTESNRERMTSDPNTADIETIDAMLDQRLEKRHWDAVQDVWNLLGTLWPESAALEKRLTGVTPTKLPHRQFTNQHGAYKGGYFPISYRSDIAANADIKEKQTEDRFKQLKSGIATRVNTPQGRLQERQTTTRRPLDLSLGAILSHIDDTTTDLYLREEATRLDRIFRDREFRSAVEDTHGIEYLKTLETVLKRTVSGSERAQDVGEKFLQGFRVNASVAILGANIPTALLAPVSYFQTVIPRHGIKTVLAGISEFFSNPVAANKLILEKSAFMRERQDTYSREAHELVRKTPLRSKWGRIQGAGFLLMTTAEKYTVSGPVWIGVYRKAIADGETEANAVTLADRSIATTQGSGLEIDQSTLQSGNEAMRAFTFMWGYLSGLYGTVRGDIANRDGISKVLPIMKHLIVFNAMAAALETIVRGEAWDDDDDPYIVEFLNRFRRNIEGIIPGVSLVTSPFDSSAPAIQSAKGVADTIRSYGAVADDIYEQGYVDADTRNRALRETVKGAGIFAGVPGTIQADRALKTFLEDDDPTIMEYLMTGPDKDN